MKYRIFFFLLKAVITITIGFVSLSLWLLQIKLLGSELEKTPTKSIHHYYFISEQ